MGTQTGIWNSSGKWSLCGSRPRSDKQKVRLTEGLLPGFLWRAVFTSGNWAVMSEGHRVNGSICRDISGFSDGSGEGEPGAANVSRTQTCLSL